MIYCYPKLSERDFLFFRFFGPGLGNLLFPWARAVVYAERNNFKFISPTWPQLKIGTFLRRERDNRLYSNFFKDYSNSLTGYDRARVLCFSKRVSEYQEDIARNSEVIEFTGMKGLFEKILKEHVLVRNRLLEITRDEHKKGLFFNFENSVSLHVRLGDFAVAKSDAELSSGKNNTRIPLEWYRGIIQGVRKKLGEKVCVYIFSDGTDEELRLLLEMPNCRRLGFGSAIADLLALSQAKMLVASGSTFSMWASYLGRMPVIWYPGQRKQKLYFDTDTSEEEMFVFE